MARVKEKTFTPSLGGCGVVDGIYWCKQGFSRASVSHSSTLYVNKLLEYMKQLQCVNKIGARLMKNEVYSC